MADDSAIKLFLECGIDERRAKETLKNTKLKDALTSVLTQAKTVKGAADLKDTVNVLYTVASTLPAEAVAHRPALVEYVATGKIHKSNITPAIAYLKKLGSDPLNAADFEKESGVGIVITREDVTRLVGEHLNSIKAELLEQKWSYPINVLMAGLRDKLKWANQKDVKDEVDAQLLALLGPKVIEEKGKKKPAPEPKKKEEAKLDNNVEVPKEMTITFPDPTENKQKFAKLLEKHLEFSKGKVICRFPPEPNGFLHLGHAKACNLNFTYPQKSGGYTLLRFDDTNPEAEKTEYIESIIDDVTWLGHKPAAITYSSDYFPQLYDLAVQLIKSDRAYVCHQNKMEMADYREKRMDSPWRNRPVAESLKLFEDMRKGKIEEGKATLRMKMDMQADNTVLRDLVAYRIKFAPHPHVGDKWCIYPSYDYTHCIIDSLENITHSLCTLEFAVRRESYMRLLDDLEIYKPVVWEYSRLNLTHTVLSKRRLIKLVTGGYVRGWDDPRMPTVRGARRHGYTSKALNKFCDLIGVTRNENLISIGLMEQCVREDLNDIAHRSMAVFEPLKVTITNMPADEVRTISTPNHPLNMETMGSHDLPLKNVIYIERSDFREDEPKGYKRLSPGKTVGLLHAGCTITCNEVVKDSNGEISELKVTVAWDDPKKPRGYIQWVSEGSYTKMEVRLYDHLFKSAQVPKTDDWLTDLNPESLVVKTNCYGDAYTASHKVGDRLQFERLGYFIKDVDSTPENPVWTRIVTLKESGWENK